MNSEAKRAILAGLAAVAGCAAVSTLESRVAAATTDGNDRARVEAAAASGLMPAMLGGFRSAAADIAWLKAHGAWERRDAVKTVALIEAAVAADARAEFFWVNGARILAYDIAQWKIDAEPVAPEARRSLIVAEQAEVAFAFLERARTAHPESPALAIEQAQLAHRALRDPLRAAAFYREAARLPGAPDYAGRLAVELLVSAGRPEEAVAWLDDWLAEVPGDFTALQRERLAARLHELRTRALGTH